MVQINSTAPELEKAALFYGLYSRIARQLGVTSQHVSQVAKGRHRSKRVSKAIAKEIQRILNKNGERAA
jgi:DNA-binding transcriptional regulator YdaS (Cro superfamily)